MLSSIFYVRYSKKSSYQMKCREFNHVYFAFCYLLFIELNTNSKLYAINSIFSLALVYEVNSIVVAAIQIQLIGSNQTINKIIPFSTIMKIKKIKFNAIKHVRPSFFWAKNWGYSTKVDCNWLLRHLWSEDFSSIHQD